VDVRSPAEKEASRSFAENIEVMFVAFRSVSGKKQI